MDGIALLSEWGRLSLSAFWMPLLVWTIAALPFYVGLGLWSRAHPLVRYHGYLALLLALPLGFVLAPLVAPVAVSPITPPTSPPEPVLMPPTDLTFDDGLIVAAPSASEKTSAVVARPSPFDCYAWLGLASLFALVLAAYRLLRLGVQARALRRLQRQLRPLDRPEAHRLLHGLAVQLHLRRPVRLLAGPPEISPMTFGWRCPVVVLPETLLGSEADLRAALVHELIHIRRGDYAVGWAVRLVAAVFSVHPGVLLLQRQIETYRERSCDADVLSRTDLAPDVYAGLLLRLNDARTSTPAVSMFLPHHTLKHRIQAMQHLPSTASVSRRLSFALATLLLLVPAVLTACTSTESASPGTAANEIERLEAQVAYLQDEIEGVRETIKSTRDSLDTQEGLDLSEQFSQTLYMSLRENHLRLMLEEQVVALEHARMEAATEVWMERLASRE